MPHRSRAKLFRWESDSWEKEVKLWKERGTGDVRFLQHNDTKKARAAAQRRAPRVMRRSPAISRRVRRALTQVRLLMRREKTMKICANFYVSPDLKIGENAGSDRSWVWQCFDFSEEKGDELTTLAIRFANSESARRPRPAPARPRRRRRR